MAGRIPGLEAAPAVSDTGVLRDALDITSPPAMARRRVVHARHRDRDFALRRGLLIADMLGLWLALGMAMAIAGLRTATFFETLWLLPTLPFWAFLFWAYGLYRRPIRRLEPAHLEDLSSLFHALVVGTLGLWLFYKLGPPARLNFEEVAIFGLLGLPLIAGLRVALRVINLRRQGPERVFAVAPPEDVWMLRRKLANHPEYEMALVGAVSGEEDGAEDSGLLIGCGLDDVEDLMATRQIDHLVVRLDAEYIPQVRVRELMHACHREGIRFGCFPGVKKLLLPGTELNYIEGMGILTSNPPVLSRSSRLMKRSLDVIVSAVLLALFGLPMALIALAIKRDSKGSVFYRQTRVGKDGRRFRLLKFRSMVVGAERMDDELMERSVDPDWLVMDGDPRVTKVGRFLRHNSLDELPQLWNVLKGEMSLVGPRPLSERDDRQVHGRLRHRLDLVPGVTGYWQVIGRNNIPFREMLEVDYAYIASWSLWYDLKLLLRTIPVVIRRRGAN